MYIHILVYVKHIYIQHKVHFNKILSISCDIFQNFDTVIIKTPKY